jgi:hypothetical protein
VVLSVDEKSQIQALDRAQPGLPMKKGRAGTMTHDYKRNGTTTLSAALNVLDGPVGSAAIPPGDRAQGPMVIGQRMPRHRAAASRRDPMPEGPPVGRPARRHREPIRFLNRIGRDVPAGKVIHVVLDNYGSHRHQKVRARLARHPRWTSHFTPTSASWLNAAEGFLAKLTNRRLRRGGFHSLVDLQAAVNRYLAEPNRSPAPFVRTAKPDAIIAAASRGRQMLDSIH